ncbi:MAG: DUF721 domain-containing protein [Desulfuromonadales bacterium]|nr:DUF721 domain-containing protein [Desulfuromonadales bacterium]NIS40682.1 DUF721 domain-containing protein [Desulfuromonadales bacterium]
MSKEKRPPMAKAEPVQRLLEGILKDKGMDGKLREFRTWLVWDQAVGPQIARNARPLRIRDGILELRVAHPVWMQQLQLMKPQLLKKLNERLEGARIRDLYFRRGKIAEQPPAEPPSPAEKWRQVELSDEERQQIEESLKNLADPDLKRHLRQLYTRQCKLDKARHDD